MEDYNNNNNEQKNNVCFENHCWKKCLASLIAAFIGGFLAFYFIADQMVYKYNKHHFNPHKFERRMYNDFEKQYKHEMKSFDDMFKKYDKMPKFNRNDLTMPFFMMDAVKIKTEFEDNNFNVIIDSKPFEGNIDKIKYNVSGRKLTVFGSSEIKNKEIEQDIAFSQDFILPSNADTTNIKKEKDGKKIIISVPLKEE